MTGGRRVGSGDALLRLLEHLARPGRLALFRSVLQAGPEGVSREILVRRLRTTGSALTFHLRALAEVGLIQIRVTPGEHGEGRTMHCMAAPEVLAEAVEGLLHEDGHPSTPGLEAPPQPRPAR